MSFSLHRLLRSARVCALTAVEVAVLGTGTDLMSAEQDSAREAPAATGRHRAAVAGVRGASGASGALR